MRNKKKVCERNPTMEKQSGYKAVAVSIPLSKPVGVDCLCSLVVQCLVLPGMPAPLGRFTTCPWRYTTQQTHLEVFWSNHFSCKVIRFQTKQCSNCCFCFEESLYKLYTKLKSLAFWWYCFKQNLYFLCIFVAFLCFLGIFFA